VAHPGSRRIASDAGPLFDSSADFAPYARTHRWLARGKCPARRGASTASAGSKKEDGTGAVSYDPLNHEKMVRLRAEKVAGIAADIPELTRKAAQGDYSSSAGATPSGPSRPLCSAPAVAARRSLTPPALSESVAAKHGRVAEALPPRACSGIEQRSAAVLLRSRFAIEAVGLHKIQGRPFLACEIEEAIDNNCGTRWCEHDIA